MKTLRFTDQDYQTLLMMLGFASGAHMRNSASAELPDAFKEVVDWTLTQGDPSNRTYWNHKDLLRHRKEAELRGESERYS